MRARTERQIRSSVVNARSISDRIQRFGNVTFHPLLDDDDDDDARGFISDTGANNNRGIRVRLLRSRIVTSGGLLTFANKLCLIPL